MTARRGMASGGPAWKMVELVAMSTRMTPKIGSELLGHKQCFIAERIEFTQLRSHESSRTITCIKSLIIQRQSSRLDRLCMLIKNLQLCHCMHFKDGFVKMMLPVNYKNVTVRLFNTVLYNRLRIINIKNTFLVV